MQILISQFIFQVSPWPLRSNRSSIRFFDLYKFTLIGAMTSDANVNMTFHIFSGATRILTYTAVGDALYNQGFEFSTTVHVTNPSANVA